MVFASLEFLLLFFPLFLIAYAVSPSKARNTVLLGASWVFYGWWSPIFLLMLIGLTWLTWVGANATMAAWLYEQNGRRVNRAITVSSCNAVMCAAIATAVAWFRF